MDFSARVIIYQIKFKCFIFKIIDVAQKLGKNLRQDNH